MMMRRFRPLSFGSFRQELRLLVLLLGLTVLCVVVPLFVLAGRMVTSAHALAEGGAAERALTGELDRLLQQHRLLVTRAVRSEEASERALAVDQLARIGAELSGMQPALAHVAERLGDRAGDVTEALAALLAAGDHLINQGSSARVSDEMAALRYSANYAAVSDAVRRWLAALADTMGQQVVLLSAGSAIVTLWTIGSVAALVGVGACLMSLGRRTEGRLRHLRLRMLQASVPGDHAERVSMGHGDELDSFSRVGDHVLRHLESITARHSALQIVNARWESALSNMSQGICMFDSSGCVEIFNQHLFEILRLEPGEIYHGMTSRAFLQRVMEAAGVPDIDESVQDRQSKIDRREAGSILEIFADGRMVSVVHWPLPDGGHAAIFDDVTERRSADAQIAYMARHDALTGLPNRLVLQERIEQELIETGRGGRSAILFLDVDHFKRVNDALGHPVGDGLLRAVSDRLLACIREGDMVARLGGDEFAIVQAGITRPEDAKLLAERIMTTLAPAFVVEGHNIVVTASIGLALMPEDGRDTATLLKNADMALYRAKHDQRGTFSFFEADMDARLQLRRQLEVDLRTGLADDAFELYYQPMVNPVTERVIGFEALLRWRHPSRGMVSPVEFIPIAEEIGLIVPLGEWVIRTACLEAARWPDQIKVALNLSPTQFRSRNLVAVVAAALQESGLAASRLELEVTETLLLQESESTISMLHGLRALGARISMDDFGTGYSSLSYLRSFPFDKIKIDQSFIRDLSKREDAIHIVRAIRGLCAGLGMNTTAEGVETEEQFAKIRSEGCTEAQGYLFSPPRPAADVLAMIHRIQARNADHPALIELSS